MWRNPNDELLQFFREHFFDQSHNTFAADSWEHLYVKRLQSDRRVDWSGTIVFRKTQQQHTTVYCVRTPRTRMCVLIFKSTSLHNGAGCKGARPKRCSERQAPSARLDKRCLIIIICGVWCCWLAWVYLGCTDCITGARVAKCWCVWQLHGDGCRSFTSKTNCLVIPLLRTKWKPIMLVYNWKIYRLKLRMILKSIAWLLNWLKLWLNK